MNPTNLGNGWKSSANKSGSFARELLARIAMLACFSASQLILMILLLSLTEQAFTAEQDVYEHARALEQKEDYSRAAAIYEEILAGKPDEYWATVRVAHDYARLGRLEDARRTFAKAKKINRKEAAAYIEEGYAVTDAGDEAEAKKTWTELIACDTSSFVGYHHMGATMAREGRQAEAEYYLKESVKRLEAESDPRVHHDDLMHSLIALGGLLAQQSRLGEAAALYREGVEKSRRDPPNRAQFLAALASVQAYQGRNAEAEGIFRRALATCRPEGACFRTAHANVLDGFARYYLARGRRAEAKKMVEMEAKLYDPFGDVPLLAFPFSITQLSSVAALYVSLGDGAKAEGIYRRLIALRSSMPSNEALIEAESLLAERCAKTGRFAESERLYVDAIGILVRRGEFGQAGSVTDRLADAYRREGRSWKARWARMRATALGD
jgi:tetratricopeptide (TPR) repeat protein